MSNLLDGAERFSAGLGIKAYMHRACADLLLPLGMLQPTDPFYAELTGLYCHAERVLNTFDLEGKIGGIEPSNMIAWMPVQMFMMELDAFEGRLTDGKWQEFLRVMVIPKMRASLAELRDGLGIAVVTNQPKKR